MVDGVNGDGLAVALGQLHKFKFEFGSHVAPRERFQSMVAGDAFWELFTVLRSMADLRLVKF